jgi:hypothetical protein
VEKCLGTAQLPSIALDRRSVHDPGMSEDEIGEIRAELKAYKEQLDALKEDLKILILFSNRHLIGQVQQYLSGVPNAGEGEIREVSSTVRFSSQVNARISLSAWRILRGSIPTDQPIGKSNRICCRSISIYRSQTGSG